MTVGERIKLRRIELGLSQEELAKRMGYSGKTSVSKAETSGDGVTTTKIAKFADALMTTPAHLMGWTDEPITIDIEERKDDVMEQLIDTYAKRELLTPFIKMLNEMSEDHRTKALNYIKEVYKEYLFDKAMKGE